MWPNDYDIYVKSSKKIAANTIENGNLLATELLDITRVKAMDAMLGNNPEAHKTVLNASRMAMQGYPHRPAAITLAPTLY